MSEALKPKVDALKKEISTIFVIHSNLINKPYIYDEFDGIKEAIDYLVDKSTELCKELDILESPQVDTTQPSEAINLEVANGN
jgi:hypothetical protein